MARVLWLPEVLRKAGLTVHEEPGWRTRGYDGFNPVAVVCHATAGSRTATDRGEINVLLRGSTTAPPPIAQLYLSRSGEVWVVASGTCNHIGDAVLDGTGQRGNDNAIGIEAANDNRGEPWPEAQYSAYVRMVAAICRHQGWSTKRVFGHKEISYTGKTDPTFPMNPFRAEVAAVLSGEEVDDVSAKDVWQTDNVARAPRVDGLGRALPLDAHGNPKDNPYWTPGNMLRNTFEVTAHARGEQLAQHEALMAALRAHSDMPDADFEQIKAAAKAGAQEALAAADIAVSWGPQGA